MSLPAVFNHDIRLALTTPSIGKKFYSGRALAISKPSDIVQLHPSMKRLWPAITSHYQRTGLTFSRNPVWDISLEKCKQHPFHTLSLFIYADASSPVSQEAEWIKSNDQALFNTVTWINSKNNFISLARKMGIQVPATETFEDKSCFSLESVRYPCFFKPAVSVSGEGIISCRDLSGLIKAIQEFPTKKSFQVQEKIPAKRFLNLQYLVVHGRAERLAATEEIVEGCTHRGSRFPVTGAPWTLFDPTADLLARRGMKGLFAFDVMDLGEGNKPRYLALECNPRFNGSSYPTLIAGKLGIKTWSSEVIKSSLRNLDDIDLEMLEYSPVSKTGIILVNWGTILSGQIEVMFAGTSEQQAELKTKLLERL